MAVQRVLQGDCVTICIIAVKKKDQTFSPKYVEKMYDMGNRDGFGMMYVEPVDGVDRVQVVKSMLGWQGIMDLYEKQMDRDIAVHVRNASLGMPKNLENCHPFKILSLDDGDKIDLYMMHNGRFGEIQVDKQYSDSWNFATKFLRGYLKKHPSALQDEDFQYFLAGIIGNNKLVFLDNKNRFTIVNSDLGTKHPTGVWVSTKSDIKLTAIIVTPKTPKIVNITGAQFGESPAWTYGKGKWEPDSDNRLHFVAANEPKKLSEKGDEHISAGAQKGDIDNGTDDDEETSEKAILEVMQELPAMNLTEVYNFVVDFHKESLQILSALTDKDKGELKLMISANPWNAAEMMLKHSKGTVAKATANLN